MSKILSVIIPTYNAENFLEKCLASFDKMEKHILKKCEILVVNDGTPDNSMQIAEKFAKKEPDVFKIVNKKNGGHGSAINAGVEHIQGSYFKVVDADDWVDTKEAVKVIIDLEIETADVILTGYRTFDVQTEEYEQYSITLDDYNRQYNLAQLMEQWRNVEWGFTFHGIIYRTDFYRQKHCKLIEHVYYEDWEYATIPLCYAEKIRCSNTHMYCYRIGDVNQSVSTQNQVKRLDDTSKVIERLLEKGKNRTEFSAGGCEYWKKKTTMLINSFYEIALLMDRKKKEGRKKAKTLHSKIVQEAPGIAQENKCKYQIFMILNHMHVSDQVYRKILNVVKGK